MMGTHCKDCEHFIFWRDNNNSFDSEPEGVCTAPRPLLGPPPNREVNKADGLNCPSFEATGLESELPIDQAKAQVAAAYRKAAEVCGHNISTEADDALAVMIEENILALTPADAEAELEAYVQERVNEALDKEDVEIKAAVLILLRAVDLGIVEGNKTTAALDLLRAKFSPNEIATGVLAPSEQ